jgi:hypothetical protein
VTYSVSQEADSKQAAEDAQRAADLVKKEHDAQLKAKDEAMGLAKKEHDAQLKTENTNIKGLAEALKAKDKELENQRRLTEETKASAGEEVIANELKQQELESTKVIFFI